MKTFRFPLLALLYLYPFWLRAQSPRTINIQGVLSQASGQPVLDGQYMLTFRIYASAQESGFLWEEKQENVQVQAGVFSTILGKINPLNLPFDKPYFLGIRTGQEPEMTPRIEMTSTPYSLMAKNVENNAITADKIQANAVTVEKISSPLVSSLNGITNDGGNINIVAGANITILSNDQDNTITISAVNAGNGTAGISRINAGNAISVTGPDGPTTTISVSPNAITNSEIQNNTITTDKIVPNVLSSLSGVSNDGGNINLVAGNNISIVPNDANKTITISTSGTGGGGSGNISQLTEGNGIGILNPLGPNTTIGLKPNILLGPGGSLHLLNQNSVAVAGISTSTSNLGGVLSISNGQGTQIFGVSSFLDGQPLLGLNSRLGRQVVDIKANEFSDGEINVKSVLTNTAVRLMADENAGGLINIFNRFGNITAQMNSTPDGSGRLTLNSVDSRRVLELETNPAGGGVLRLYNIEGTEALRLTTFETFGGSVRVANRAGLVAARLNATTAGDGLLSIFNNNEQEAAYLTINNNGGGIFGILNGENAEVARISALSNGQPRLLLNNRLEVSVVDLRANEFSDGELTLNSVLANPTLRLTANDNAGGIINVFNREGQTMAAILDNGNGGFIDILNNDGTEVITMGITSENSNARINVNNRLGRSSAELFANEFSDGQLTLNSVLNNPTVIAGANDNAGGLVNIFSQDGKRAARLTEVAGGFFGIYNTDETEMIQIGTLEDRNGLIRVNNRLGNPVADMQSNDFSDGQITLGSVEKNKTLLLTANDNAGGLINVFNRSGSISAQLTETEGDGLIKIFNRDSQLVHQMRVQENRAGLFEIKSIFKNPENVAEMGGNEDDEGHLYLFNRNSKVAAYLSAAGGDGDLSLSDIDGKIKTSLSGSRFGGTLSIRNENNEPVHFMGSNGKTKEGFYSIFNKSDINKNRLSMGGDSLGNGYLNVFNYNGLNTFFMGHNQFADGTISLKNSMGNLGVLFDALKDGGSVTVTDGKPGTNHRGVLLNGLNGGKLSLFNNQTRLVNVLGVGDNGEGLLQIVNKQDLTKNRLEMGGDDAAAGYLKLFNSNASKTAELGAFPGGSGFLSTYGPNGKRQTHLAQFGDGGAIYVMDNNETAVGTLAYDGNGGLAWVTNKERKGGAFMTHNTLGGDIHIRNNSEKIGAEMTTAANLGGELNIYNSNGGNTSRLSNTAAGGGLIEVGTANGGKVGRMTILDGSGYIGLDNVDKTEVVRITANLGKGGGMGIRNPAGADIINLTQDNSYGAILVNNPAGSLLATITHATNGAGIILNKDHKGGDAVWLLGHETGGGNILTYNNLGKVAASITQNTSSQGKVQVNGSAGNEIARITGTAAGTGLVSIDNNMGINLAGIGSNTSTGGGNIYVNNNSGKETARLTTTAAGTGLVSIDNSAGINLAALASNTLTGGGYIYANNASGKEIARMANYTSGDGYVSASNSASAEVAYLSTSNNKGGYIGVANSTGTEKARMFSTSSGGGYMNVFNPSGTDVARLAFGGTNNGLVQTASSSGTTLTTLGSTPTNQGYVGVNSNTGLELAYMMGQDFGGEIGVRDPNGNRRTWLSGAGSLTVSDQDGSYFNASAFGNGVQLFFVDKFQHPRMEIGAGFVSSKGPNGGESSYLSNLVGSQHLGFIGVRNSSVFEGATEAGMYVNTSGQGVLFADIKNFKMDYPGKPDKQIWYGSLEGPELAAYIRGTGKLVNGKASIEFTDHYQKVANTGTMTVILTPLSGKSRGLAVVSKKPTGFDVEELMEGSGTYEFDWEVKCVRHGHEGFEVVRNKQDDPKPFSPKSEFPMKTESRAPGLFPSDKGFIGNTVAHEVVIKNKE